MSQHDLPWLGQGRQQPKKETSNMESNIIKQGGFSDEVAEASEFQSHAKTDVGGWINHSARTKRFDKSVEHWLRETGLKEHGIATWLTSGNARHTADALYRGMPDDELNETLERNTANAFVKVTLWGHPDHNGFQVSTRALYPLIAREFSKEAQA